MTEQQGTKQSLSRFWLLLPCILLLASSCQYPRSCMESKIRQKSVAKILPVSLLVLLFAVALVTVFVQADSYGITLDEPNLDSYGRLALAWYQTLGRDQSSTHYHGSRYRLEHGAIFDVIVAL